MRRHHELERRRVDRERGRVEHLEHELLADVERVGLGEPHRVRRRLVDGEVLRRAAVGVAEAKHVRPRGARLSEVLPPQQRRRARGAGGGAGGGGDERGVDGAAAAGAARAQPAGGDAARDEGVDARLRAQLR